MIPIVRELILANLAIMISIHFVQDLDPFSIGLLCFVFRNVSIVVFVTRKPFTHARLVRAKQGRPARLVDPAGTLVLLLVALGLRLALVRLGLVRREPVA